MRLWIIWPCNTAVSMSLVTPAYNLKMAHVLTPARHNKLKTWLHLIHFATIHTVNLSVVDTILHDSPDLVIHKTDIWAVWRPQVGPKNVWCFLMQQFNCCTCWVHCAGALSCWNTKFLLPDTLRIAGMTSLCSTEEDSKRYYQNFLLCNNNEITRIYYRMHCRFIQQFCEAVYVVAFFKVVQQQTIGKLGNSVICLWADNFCLQQWKNY